LLWDRVEARQDQLVNGVRIKSGASVLGPGMRIEFVAIDTPVLPNEHLFQIDLVKHSEFIHSKKKLQVHYLEELDYYLQYRDMMRINSLWYLEAQMYNPLAELMNAVFKTPADRGIMAEQLAVHKARRKLAGKLIGRFMPPTARPSMLRSNASQDWYSGKLKRLALWSPSAHKRARAFMAQRRDLMDELHRLVMRSGGGVGRVDEIEGEGEGQSEHSVGDQACWMSILPLRLWTGGWTRGRFSLVVDMKLKLPSLQYENDTTVLEPESPPELS
jgi:hypothetical protein